MLQRDAFITSSTIPQPDSGGPQDFSALQAALSFSADGNRVSRSHRCSLKEMDHSLGDRHRDTKPHLAARRISRKSGFRTATSSPKGLVPADLRSLISTSTNKN